MGSGPTGWIGKFAIPDEEYEPFLALAHEHIFVKNKACSLLEKHLPQGPILIDLDFRYPAGGPLTRRFTEEHLERFVTAYAAAFYKFFKEPTETGPLQFFVMLKPAPENDAAHGNHKDGVHIVCPNITTRPEIQFALRGYLLQSGIIESIFGETGCTNAPQDVFDLSVIATNNWFLYGACKPDKAWYKVTNLYEATEKGIDELDPSELAPIELMKALSIRHGHSKVTEITLKEGVDVDWLQLVQRWGKGSNFAKVTTKSPSLKSTAATGGEPPLLSLSSAADASAAAADMIQVSGLSVRSELTESDINLAYRLVRECLNPAVRAKNYQEWLKLGMLLHNISPSEKTCDEWATFSRRVKGSESTPDSVYKEKWAVLPAANSAMQKGRRVLMIGTLHMWAKQDAAIIYRDIIRETNTELALLNSSGTHDSIANMVLRMYRDEFRCTPPKKGATATAFEWYQYEKNSWRSLMTWTTLRSRLGNEVREVYLRAEVKIAEDEMNATNDSAKKELLQAQKKNILKIQTQLQTTGFKECVMKEVTDKFYSEDFLQTMNMDPTLVGFENGVLELRSIGSDGKPHVLFRPGRPDDCISFQMGRGLVGLDAFPYVAYDPTAASQPPEYAEIMDFFCKIYPDPVLREYVLTLYSSCLEGANREQKFYTMSGGGGNGKSKIIDLMAKTFGEYQDSLSATALTRKRADAGNANPEFIDLKNKRFVSMVEPEEGEKINTSLMKQLSGQDMLKVRGLYKSQEGFVFTARIFMSCNALPGVSSMDNGTWRRIVVIPHVATFVEEGKPTDPANNIHPRDPLLDSKITRWRPYFASLLVWYYENHYLKHGLKEPAVVLTASNKYKEENDAFAAFCQDCVVRETGTETKANDILSRYKEWTRFNAGKKIMQKKDILLRLTEVYGKPVDAAGKTYAGFRLAYDDEDISGNVIATI